MLKNISKISIWVFVLGLVIGSSYTYLFLNLSKDYSQDLFLEKREEAHGYISPLLDCSPNKFSSNYLIGDFYKKIESYVNDQIKHNERVQISVYFRDMRNGPIVRINSDKEILPGSLLKVPLVIGYLKKSESKPELLNQTIRFEDKSLFARYEVQGVKPAEFLKLGSSYTIRQLIEAAIVRSDNVAASLLERHDQHVSLKEASLEMDIPVRSGVPPFRKLTLEEYATFFRILYNATYLNSANSNYLLELLSRSDFKDGIAAGVPVNVANKFGEAVSADSQFSYLHDCGIVYYPSNPYLLCISISSLSGADPSSVKKIADISRYIYQLFNTLKVQKN